MNVHQLCVAQPKKMLQNLTSWLKDAEAFAEEHGFEADRWLETRLAVDQFSLVRQIQSACDSAKFIAARLGGPDAPSFPDEEKTMAEVHARIDATVAYLDSVPEDALDGGVDKAFGLPFLPEGATVTGQEYVIAFALPNFYFHISMAYAILRDGGVKLGKRKFIGSMDVKTA